MNYMFELMQDFRTGLSLHYPLIYSIVVGLETKNAFEFGAGWSTRVIIDALKETSGNLHSISTDTQRDVMLKTHGGALDDAWTHTQGRTPEDYNLLPKFKNAFDFVLHDGSHTEDVVFQDLTFILPKMKYNSILCVHDVLLSGRGQGMRNAVDDALKEYEYEIITLPYSYGLSVVVLKDNKFNGIVQITRKKPDNRYHTEQI